MKRRMSISERRDYSHEIQKRLYELCDSEGHQMPDEQTGMCNYCNRHLFQTEQQKHNDKLMGLIKITDKLGNK